MRVVALVVLLVFLSVTFMASSASTLKAAGGFHTYLPIVTHSEPVILPPAPALSDIRGVMTMVHKYEDRNSADIYTLRADGSALTNLTNTPTMSEMAWAWSPDNQEIFYSAYEPEQPIKLYIMNSDGSNKRLITAPDTPAYDREVVWSSQGDIAYRGLRTYEIFVIRHGSSVATTPIPNTAYVGDTKMEWSPDGKWLGFTNSDNNQVYYAAPDGTDLTQVTEPGQDGSWYYFEGWMDDGKSIIVSRLPHDYGFDIWKISRDGTTETQLTDRSERALGVLGIAPDNQKLLYLQHSNIFTPYNVALRDLTKPTPISYATLATCDSSVCSFQNASWSADSNIVAWEYTQEVVSQTIYVYYAVAPFRRPHLLGSAENPQLIGALLFYKDYRYIPDQGSESVIRALDVQSGAQYDILTPGLLEYISTYEWRYIPQ